MQRCKGNQAMNAADRNLIRNFDERLASIMPHEHLEEIMARFTGTRQAWAAVLARKTLQNRNA